MWCRIPHCLGIMLKNAHPAFVPSRIDCCNSLLSGVSSSDRNQQDFFIDCPQNLEQTFGSYLQKLIATDNSNSSLQYQSAGLLVVPRMSQKVEWVERALQNQIWQADSLYTFMIKPPCAPNKSVHQHLVEYFKN